MKIWVDADACPVVIKEIIFRAAKRTSTHTMLVANQHIRVPPSPFIKSIQVASGFDVADDVGDRATHLVADLGHEEVRNRCSNVLDA